MVSIITFGQHLAIAATVMLQLATNSQILHIKCMKFQMSLEFGVLS